MATIVLAGGGTAGHIEPALAVARAWKTANPDDQILFIGTNLGLENKLVPASGFNLIHIPKISITRKISLSWLRVPRDLLNAVLVSRRAIKGADLLIGFGGYVSAPPYLAAKFSGIPIVVHEANAKPGLANYLGSFLSSNLAVADAHHSGRFMNSLITGLPLRSDVAEAVAASHANFKVARLTAKKRLGFAEDAPLIFVMGGSQGSVAINSVIADAVPALLSKGISILHSVGHGNVLPNVNGAYRPVAYVDVMADAYLASDLVIARSGAVTCSEFRALGRYALFVPLPIGNGEQFHNASALISQKRAEIIDQSHFTSEYLALHIDELIAKSALSPIDGSDQDLAAADKIVALGEFAISRQ